jgi:uncharacterized protein
MNSEFKKIDFYDNKKNNYHLLPFKFLELSDQKIILTNMVGEYFITDRKLLNQLVSSNLSHNSKDYINLRSKHFLYDKHSESAKDLLSIKYRTKKASLSEFTSLHMFVVTLRCEHSCPYCQVSRQTDDKFKYDMDRQTALKAIDFALMSPSNNLKFEFQGGEPLLNFPLIKFIVNESEKRKGEKKITYVIATNLALIDDQIIEFCNEHDIYISTSLDGPKELHNKNRPRPGKNSYEKTIDGIRLCQEKLGNHKISALMTTTEESLGAVKNIIDEYIKNKFDGIFLRPLSPYGFAIKTKKIIEYNNTKWIDFYKKGLDYIIDINKKGKFFTEFYTTVILKKIFTFQDPGYVDLMSPSGAGIAAIIYNYDGNIFSSDEGRMLFEMGDDKFLIGNLIEDSYKDVFLNNKLLDPIEDSFSESVPMCTDCAFENYCGSDPVYHYSVFKDFVGRKPESDFCNRNMTVIKHIFNKMNNDKEVKKIFLSWLN